MSTPPKAAAEQQPPSSGRRWLPGLSVGQAAALVGLIGSIIGLVFIFKPGWKPSPPQDRGMVEIGETRVRQPVTFKRYLQRLKLPPGTLSSGMLRRRGVMIEFHAHIVGLRGKELPIRWELNDASNEDLVAEDQAVSIVPSTNDEGRKWFVWAPLPKSRGTYYITVTIYQPPKGSVDVPLQDFDSPTFRGLAP
jgi:hypothetical protein